MNKNRAASEGFDLTNFLPYKLSLLSRLTQNLLQSELVKAGVTVAQWRVLLCLAKSGPSHLNGISDFTMLPQSSLSRSVAQMAERNLVRNERNEDDRRLSRIALTVHGKKQVARLTNALQAAFSQAFAMNASREALFLKTVDELITRLADRLEEPLPAPIPVAAAGPADGRPREPRKPRSRSSSREQPERSPPR